MKNYFELRLFSKVYILKTPEISLSFTFYSDYKSIRFAFIFFYIKLERVETFEMKAKDYLGEI